MIRYSFYTLIIALCASCQSTEKWENLLDKDLSKWEAFLGVPHRTVSIPNYPKTDSDGIKGTPLGLGKDPLKVFQAYEEGKETILKVTGQVYGGLTTKKEYSNYHFKCQFKWGDKKWEPRLDKLRDSGILYHAYGDHGTFWNTWKYSLEFQIQEGDCGDFIPVGKDIKVKIPVRYKEGIRRPIYDNSMPLANVRYTTHAPCKESPHGEWNTIEILTIGQTSVFLVNSEPVMALFEAVKIDQDNTEIPLTKGQIQIQAEGAELYYRDMKIKTITEFPEHLKAYARTSK